jgi:hypothetical protein
MTSLTQAKREYGNCPQCDYSATPDEILGRERSHFWPHSLRCVRCGYQTETKATWDGAKAAWNRPALSALQRDSRMVPLETLQWWRQLVDLNPQDLAPRLDAYIADQRGVKS